MPRPPDTLRAARPIGGLPTAILVSPDDAAARIGVSRDTVCRLIALGQLPAVRVTATPGAVGRLMVRVRDLEQWAARLPTITG